MLKILISNDDGINALGIKSLAAQMKKLGEVFVIAPDRERSTASHSLTLHRPLRINKSGKNTFEIDGTPSDCINLGINWIMKSRPPDLVVSGINHGANLGDDLTYSGTAAAAMEATIQGIPSIAVSLAGNMPTVKNFEYAASFAAKLSRKVLKNGLPENIFLNVNVPGLNGSKPNGYKFTSMGKRFYSQEIEEKIDPRGKKYYWIGGMGSGFKNIVNTDCHTVSKGKISITPVKMDLTDRSCLKRIMNWNL